MDTFNRTYFIYDQSTGYVPPSFPSISTFPNIHGSQRLSRITGYGQTAPRSSARVLKASSFLSSYVTQKCQSFLCFFILYASPTLSLFLHLDHVHSSHQSEGRHLITHTFHFYLAPSRTIAIALSTSLEYNASCT